MKARKANVGGKWVAVQRGLRYGTKASAGQTFHALLPEKP
jgi:hypothetical protein